MTSEESGSSPEMDHDQISSLTHHLFDMKLSIETYNEVLDTDCKALL